MKRVALPRIKLQDLGGARMEGKAQELAARAKKLMAGNPDFSRVCEAKIDKRHFKLDLEEKGHIKGTALAVRGQRIFARLVATALKQCPAACRFEWKMAIVRDPVPDQGWAYGSGYIAISDATAALPADAEIAATIAHEMGHIICGHCRLEWGLNEVVDRLPVSKKKSARRALRMVLRRNELEADVFSIRLLHAAGFAPEAAIASLERDLAHDAGLKPEYKHTHPSFARRIARLRRELKKLS